MSGTKLVIRMRCEYIRFWYRPPAAPNAFVNNGIASRAVRRDALPSVVSRREGQPYGVFMSWAFTARRGTIRSQNAEYAVDEEACVDAPMGRLAYLPAGVAGPDPDAFLSDVLTGWRRAQLSDGLPSALDDLANSVHPVLGRSDLDAVHQRG